MSMIKRGTCVGKVAVAENMYSCPECGYKEVGEACCMKCPECGAIMEPLSRPKRRSGSRVKRE